MIRKGKSIAVLAEIVAVLARHPGLRVAPVVEEEDGVVALTVTMDREGEDGLQVVSLFHELKFVADVATLRHVAREHDIDAQKLQALIPAMHEDAPPHEARHLTVLELEAVVAALTADEDENPEVDPQLIDSAVPKLVALGRALQAAI